jgi:hypothetical protein
VRIKYKSGYYVRKSGDLTLPRTIIRYMCVKCEKRLHARKDCMMEAGKLNNEMAKSSPSAAGFFTAGLAGRFLRSGCIRIQDMPTRWMKKFHG